MFWMVYCSQIKSGCRHRFKMEWHCLSTLHSLFLTFVPDSLFFQKSEAVVISAVFACIGKGDIHLHLDKSICQRIIFPVVIVPKPVNIDDPVNAPRLYLFYVMLGEQTAGSYCNNENNNYKCHNRFPFRPGITKEIFQNAEDQTPDHNSRNTG
jgi:hypothetical protein